MTGLPDRTARTVLIYGCFDRLGQRELEILRSAAQMGDELIVGCTTDSHAVNQGHPTASAFSARKAMLESCRYVSRVIPHDSPAQFHTDIVNYNVSLLILGSEYRAQVEHLSEISEVICLPHLQAEPALTATVDALAS